MNADVVKEKQLSLRNKLVDTALEWERTFGIAPAITSALSEYDAAMLVGCLECDYAKSLLNRTAVSKGHDFSHQGLRYQVKANRPSGKPGSFVTLSMHRKKDKPWNYDWDKLIWILYNERYEIQEAWTFDSIQFRSLFEYKHRLGPGDLRKGKKLY